MTHYAGCYLHPGHEACDKPPAAVPEESLDKDTQQAYAFNGKPVTSGNTRFQYDHPIEFAEKVLGIKPNRRQRELGIPWYTEDQKKFFDSVISWSSTQAE